MMKFLLMIFLISSVTSFASELSLQETVDSLSYELQGSEPIPEKDFVLVRNVLSLEISDNVFVCQGDIRDKGTLGRFFDTFMYSSAQSKITLEASNTEPVLVAVYESESQTVKYEFKTTKDLTKVVSFQYTNMNYTLGQKNVGTLVKPIMEKVKNLTSTTKASCGLYKLK